MALRMKWLGNIRRGVIRFGLKLLTKPLKQVTLQVPNDMVRLKRYIRKGDVVLVEGNERISECIKYLTQSSWSHAVIYVGDEPLRRDPQVREQLLDQFGEEARHLIVEALPEEGVVLAPLQKYRDFNIRVCRPFNLSRADCAAVLDEVLSNVGYRYDFKNIFDLARYFLPVHLIPRRFRRTALEFGSAEPTHVICSSMIANAFRKVKFPIVPQFKEPPLADEEQAGLVRLIRRPAAGARRFGVLQPVPIAFITPRDFDLSPYFEVIKFNLIEDIKFDYRKIIWADEEEGDGRLEKRASPR
jgi:Permuted papain-like amidase enzyme, YaeF/YiiX, C92 family